MDYQKSNEYQEILDRIYGTLQLDQDVVIFGKKEIDTNSTKKSILDWLESLGVIRIGYDMPSDKSKSNYSPELDYESPPRRHALPYDPLLVKGALEDHNRQYKEWQDKRDRKIKKELDQLDWQIPVYIKKEKFLKFYKKFLKSKKVSTSNSGIKETKTLITKDVMGKFRYNGKVLKLNNPTKIYYLIFDCLYCYDLSNIQGGLCPYDVINKYLEDHGKKPLDDKIKIRKRIDNGLASLFRFSDLPKTTPDKKELIEVVRGEGLILNNPQV